MERHELFGMAMEAGESTETIVPEGPELIWHFGT